MTRSSIVIAIPIAIVAASTLAVAQPEPSEPSVPPDTVPVEPAPAEPPPPPPPEPPIAKAEPKQPDAPVKITAVAGKGITFKSEPFSLNLRARGQIRFQLHAPPADESANRKLDETTQVGGVRVWLSGHTVSPKILYNIQLGLADRDYRDGTISPVLDTFIEYKAHRDLNVRVGQFFVPFDRLRTVREFGLQMADRPRPVNELTLDRDAGIILFSDNFLAKDSIVAWRAGIFGGNGINKSTPSEVGFMPVARLELRPLGPIDDDFEGDQQRRAKPGLALGTGVAANFNANRTRSTNGGTFVTGKTTTFYHFAADATFKWRGIAAQLEYLWRGATKKQLSGEVDELVVTEHARQGSGWILQASYTFDPPFEVVGRVSRLYAPSETDPKYRTEVERLGQEYAVGANYYFNGHQLKLQTDYIVRTGTGASHTADRDHVFHLQLDVTF